MNGNLDLYCITILPFGYSGNALPTSCGITEEYFGNTSKIHIHIIYISLRISDKILSKF
jgi:hypothetical protein